MRLASQFAIRVVLALVTPGVSISNTCLALMSLLRGAFMLSGALRLNTLRVVGNVAEWCQAD